MTRHRFLSSVLVLSALALAPRLAHADAAPPDTCTGEGTSCNNAGASWNQPGLCTMTTCQKATPDGGSMTYNCLRCLESDAGAAGAAGSGGSAGAGTGGSAGSATGGSAGSATGGSAGSATGGSAGSATGGSAGAGTGGSSGSAGKGSSSGDSGGCSLAAVPEGGGLAGLMMLAGAAALALSRKRR